MREKLLLLLMICLAVCCLVSGCVWRTQEWQGHDEALTVLISTGMDQYAPVSVLLNEGSRSELEQKLGMRIAVQRVEIEDPDDLEAFDLFLFDQPTWIIRLADSSRVQPLSVQIPNGEESYGKYKGSQYGFVFSGCNMVKHPKLLVLSDALEKAGIREIPFTPDAFSDALIRLSDEFPVPFAVWGEPTESSYFPLLSLFGIAPSGGNEFYLEGGNVCYDKLSQRMEEYLDWLRKAYMDHLLPEDMLVLSEYSMINMLNNNISAMAVFGSELYLNEAIRILQENGKHIAFAEIPLPGERSEIDATKRVIGTISSMSRKQESSQDLLLLLSEFSGNGSVPSVPERVGSYPFFSSGTSAEFPEILDLSAENEIVLSYLHQKHEADLSCLAPVFARVVTEKNPDLHNLYAEAINDWLNYKIANIPDNRTILRIYSSRFARSGRSEQQPGNIYSSTGQ